MDLTTLHLKKNGTHTTTTTTPTTTTTTKTKKLTVPKRIKQITQFVLLMLRLPMKMK